MAGWAQTWCTTWCAPVILAQQKSAMTRQNRQITDGWDRTWGHWASRFPKKNEGSFLEFLYLYKLYPCKLLQPSVSSCIQSLFLILTLIHLHFYIIEYYLNYYWFIFVHLEGSTLREASQRSPVWWVVLARASTAGGRGPQPQFVCWVSALRSFEHLRTQIIGIVFCNAIERWDLQSRLQRPGEMKSSSTLTRLCKDNARHFRRPDLVWHEVVCISDVGKHFVTFTIPFTKTKKTIWKASLFFSCKFASCRFEWSFLGRRLSSAWSNTSLHLGSHGGHGFSRFEPIQHVQREVKHVGSVDGFVKMYDALYSNATGLH